ncbi:MAG: winged helix DNA-binding protein [Proteobacteria bacterium]|nr:winged helix DNA-binding protein [Pseudomonadota bacterium]
MKASWRHTNIGRRLNNAVGVFEERVLELLREQGRSELSIAQLSLTRNLDVEGTRLTELAKRAAISKQSMRELVDLVASRGLVARYPDPCDGRAKLIKFTREGLRWLAAFRIALEGAEQEMREEIGEARMAELKATLAAYVEPTPRRADKRKKGSARR